MGRNRADNLRGLFVMLKWEQLPYYPTYPVEYRCVWEADLFLGEISIIEKYRLERRLKPDAPKEHWRIINHIHYETVVAETLAYEFVFTIGESYDCKISIPYDQSLTYEDLKQKAELWLKGQLTELTQSMLAELNLPNA
jgi:hypothetical protein